MYVYIITNNINNKVYVGITKDFRQRWRLHKQTSENINHPEYTKVLYNAFRKYGVANFSFRIEESNLTLEEAKLAEIKLIEKYASLTTGNGYNVTKGGDYTANQLKGEQHPLAILSENQVKDIIRRREAGELQSDVFKPYLGLLTHASLQDIWRGRSWKHLQNTVKRCSHGKAFLTDKQVRTIKLLKGTKSYKALGEDYGVPASTISNIINNKTYKNVT